MKETKSNVCIDCGGETKGRSLRCDECKRLRHNLLKRERNNHPDDKKRQYEYNKQWKKDNAASIVKYSREYYKKHKEKCDAYSVKWRLDNRERTYFISYKSYLKKSDELNIIPYHRVLYKEILDNPMVLETLQIVKKIKDYED